MPIPGTTAPAHRQGKVTRTALHCSITPAEQTNDAETPTKASTAGLLAQGDLRCKPTFDTALHRRLNGIHAGRARGQIRKRTLCGHEHTSASKHSQAPRMKQAISDGRRGRRPRRGPTAASITRKHSQFCSICSWCPVHRLQRHCTWDESGQAGRRVAARSRGVATISSDGAACVRGHGREHRAPRPQPTTLLMRLPPVGGPEGIEKHLTPQSTTCAAWGGSCRRWSCSARRERRPTAP